MQFIPVLLIFIPIVTALIVYLFKNKHINYLTLVAQAAMSILAVLYFLHFRHDMSQTLFVFGEWDALIGISMDNDMLSMSFVFLTIFAWWMVLLYVFDTKDTHHNFLFFLMFLQGVFLGFIQTNDLFNMFVFLELTTIIVAILIAFKKSGSSFRAGLYYLLLNTSGVLMFLIGIIMLYFVFGTININEIQSQMSLYGDQTIVRFAIILMLAGVSVKSAFFPVFTWLPKAHGAAQSAISALLSGLVVKGGLYLFIRINLMAQDANLNVTDFFFYIGAIGAILGGVFAFSQTSIKQLLAYSTVSQIGLIVMGISYYEANLFYGGVFHIFNHALAKMILFFGAGIIIKVYRTKTLSEIRGVFKVMPVLSVVMIIAMLSITGMPLLGGYASKSIIKYGLEVNPVRYYILYVMNISTAIIMLRLGRIFIGPKLVSYPMRKVLQSAVVIILAVTLILFGLFYTPVLHYLFEVDFSYVSVFRFQALFEYLQAMAIALLIYFIFVYKEKSFIVRVRNLSLSFETANIIFIGYVVSMTIFFIVLGRL